MSGTPSCPLGFTLLTGGARSGKSDVAQRLAMASSSEVVVVATARPDDDDMTTRIQRHKDDRPPRWRTVEEPIELRDAIGDLSENETLIIDCLTLWTSNLIFDGCDDVDIVDEAAAVANTIGGRAAPSLVVTNEVGFGVHPSTELGRRYRDLLGAVNRIFASTAQRTWLVVAGQIVVPTRLDDLL